MQHNTMAALLTASALSVPAPTGAAQTRAPKATAAGPGTQSGAPPASRKRVRPEPISPTPRSTVFGQPSPFTTSQGPSSAHTFPSPQPSIATHCTHPVAPDRQPLSKATCLQSNSSRPHAGNTTDATATHPARPPVSGVAAPRNNASEPGKGGEVDAPQEVAQLGAAGAAASERQVARTKSGGSKRAKVGEPQRDGSSRSQEGEWSICGARDMCVVHMFNTCAL